MRILFQGDSITDCYRVKEGDALDIRIGMGYALMCQAELMYEEPGKYEIFNRGVSGNRITDLYARIKSDIINLKPDVMSILIGVNDVWHELSSQNGVSAEKYEKIYDMFRNFIVHIFKIFFTIIKIFCPPSTILFQYLINIFIRPFLKYFRIILKSIINSFFQLF